MPYLRTFAIRGMAGVTVPCLALLLFALPAMAQRNSNEYFLLLASGSLCDPNDSSSCPATVKSDSGDTYEMSSTGTFDAQSKSVKVAGTFSHYSSNGNLLETGVWVADELVSFDSYGIAPGELMRHGAAFGPAAFAPRRLPISTRPIPTGGLAVFRIRLLAMSGLVRTAVLQVNCALAKVPDERPTDGIRLTFDGGGGKFDQEIGGRTMFLLTRPGINPPPAKVQQ